MKDWQIYLIAVIVLPIAYSIWFHYDKSGVGSFNTAYEGFFVVGVFGGIILIIYRLSKKIKHRRRQGSRQDMKNKHRDPWYIRKQKRNRNIIVGIIIILAFVIVYQNVDVVETTINSIINKIETGLMTDLKSEQVASKQETPVVKKSYPKVTINLSGRGTGEVWIDSTRTVIGNSYDTIHFDMKMDINMRVNDLVFFSPSMGWNLIGSDGEYYVDSCHGPQSDLGMISGTDNLHKSWELCYNVDKDINSFTLKYEKNVIGTITT